jgi:PilZ domain-containing protein
LNSEFRSTWLHKCGREEGMLAGRWDKRRKKRQPRHSPALISCGAQNPPIPCVLCDISPGGARLAPVRLHGLPDEFTLILNKDGSSRRVCRVVWRKRRHMGVQFMDSPDMVDGQQKAPGGQAPLPGLIYGSNAALCVDRKEVSISSLAAAVMALLIIAATVFYVAGLQMGEEASWAADLCESTKNFCQHPEWSAIPAALMALVYFSVKGMEL